MCAPAAGACHHDLRPQPIAIAGRDAVGVSERVSRASCSSEKLEHEPVAAVVRACRAPAYRFDLLLPHFLYYGPVVAKRDNAVALMLREGKFIFRVG
jgi:hypothetical protein